MNISFRLSNVSDGWLVMGMS